MVHPPPQSLTTRAVTHTIAKALLPQQRRLVSLVGSPSVSSRNNGDGRSHLAGLHLSLASGSGPPFSKRNPGMDHATLSDQRSWGSLDRIDGSRLLADFPGSPAFRSYPLPLAERTGAFEPGAG